MTKNWISLIDYSTKYQISVSTLRRRIRNNTIAYEVRDGKYFIEESEIEKTGRGRKPIEIPTGTLEGKDFVESNTTNQMTQVLVEELKRAYAQILTDKEEQIEQLKEEISDLRTLVRVLESEVDRLKSEASLPAHI